MITKTFRQKLSILISNLYVAYLTKVRKYDIGKHCSISWRASLDRANPRGVHIGDHCRVIIGSHILAHDYSRGLNHSMWTDTRIGHHCVIGGWSIILPGVTLGNHVFVAAGSVVTKSFPDHCMIGGNPARIIRKGTIITDKTQIQEPGELVKEQKNV